MIKSWVALGRRKSSGRTINEGLVQAEVHFNNHKLWWANKNRLPVYLQNAQPETWPAVVVLSQEAQKIEVWVALDHPSKPEFFDDLPTSLWGKARQTMGEVFQILEKFKAEVIYFRGQWAKELLEAALVGLDLASYRFKTAEDRPAYLPKMIFEGSKWPFEEAERLAENVNWARHLVNLPANEIYPESMVRRVREGLKGLKNTRVDVWDQRRLKRERMNLILAVGGASHFPPRLVHLRYRPHRSKTKLPLVIVGKGITFDTGGLDIKPPSAMRKMKKDMAGAASALSVFRLVAQAKLPISLDVYLPLAENAVGSRSFRPGDIVRSRSGLTVEIHNTDAEGRLVMADALALAAEAKGTNRPACLVDISTLTGAMKSVLGSQIAGVYSNSPKFLKTLLKAGQECGEPMWQQPLAQSMRGALRTPFADVVNADDGMGGATTAALFLENFTGGLPWIHFDIYAWRDAPEGCFLEAGANGQLIQALYFWLKSI